MGKVTHGSVKCSGCGYMFSLDDSGPCPHCGDARKTHDVNIEGTLSFEGSLAWRHVHEYYEKHLGFLIVLIIVTVGSPFLGLVLAGWMGVAVGVLIGLAALMVGFRAGTTVREIHKGP